MYRYTESLISPDARSGALVHADAVCVWGRFNRLASCIARGFQLGDLTRERRVLGP